MTTPLINIVNAARIYADKQQQQAEGAQERQQERLGRQELNQRALQQNSSLPAPDQQRAPGAGAGGEGSSSSADQQQRLDGRQQGLSADIPAADDPEVQQVFQRIYRKHLATENPESVVAHFRQELGLPDEDAEAMHQVEAEHGAARGAWARWRSSPLRRRVYVLLSHPESSRAALVIQAFLMSIILLNTVTFVIESVPHYEHTQLYDALVIVDYVCLGIFTVEFLLRLATATHPLRFLCSLASVIDILAIFPFYIELIVVGPDGDAASQTRILRVVRLLRVLRLLRAASKFKKLRVVLESIAASADVLVMLCALLLVLLVVFGSLMFYAEDALTPGTWFDSIPRGMWWAQVTLTTVGYGDMYPQSPWGKFLGGVIMFVCCVTVALPISIIGGEFTNSWGKVKAMQEGLDRSASAWRDTCELQGLMAQHRAAVEDVVAAAQRLQRDLGARVQALHSEAARWRAEAERRTKEGGKGADQSELRATLARLRSSADGLAGCQTLSKELDAVLEVSRCLCAGSMAAQLDELHATHRRLRDWMDAGGAISGDMGALARDLAAMRKALEGQDPRGSGSGVKLVSGEELQQPGSSKGKLDP